MEQAAGWVVPPQQGFDSDQSTGVHAIHRLVVQRQFLASEGLVQFRGKAGLAFGDINPRSRDQP